MYDIMSMFEDIPDEEQLAHRRNFTIQALQEEFKILDNDRNWNQLLYKESLEKIQA